MYASSDTDIGGGGAPTMVSDSGISFCDEGCQRFDVWLVGWGQWWNKDYDIWWTEVGAVSWLLCLRSQDCRHSLMSMKIAGET